MAVASRGHVEEQSSPVMGADVLLRAGLLVVAVLAITHLVVALAYGVPAHLLGAGLLLLYDAVLVVSSVVARQESIASGITIAASGLIVLSLALGAFVPGTGGVVLIAPVIVVALATTYRVRSRLGDLAVVSWVAGTIAFGVVPAAPVLGSAAPDWVVAVVRVIHAAAALGAALFLLWQSGSRLKSAARAMSAVHGDLVDAQDAVKRMNRELRRQVHELESRNREATLVSHLGSLLEVSHTAEEAYDVIARGARSLFPGLSGALLVLSENRQVVERVATWGRAATAHVVFRPEDCWAIRQGRLHIVDGADSGPRCAHVSPDESSFVCIPMTAQGSMLGVLHLAEAGAPHGGRRRAADAVRAGEPDPDPRGGRTGEGRLSDDARTLALWVAELLGLSLANFRLRETLRSQSTRDPLTGLFNRRYMEDSLERELHRAAREEGTLGTIMLDLDHFKALNDQAGHVAGDRVLRSLADLLRSHVRAGDVVCRYGGEEFTVLMPDAGLDETLARAEILRAAVEDASRTEPLPVTISAGVAVYPVHASTGSELIDAADAALYAAKARGRNRVMTAAASRST
jgi:diguanylate cyclase (GGDEF)-like protein